LTNPTLCSGTGQKGKLGGSIGSVGERPHAGGQAIFTKCWGLASQEYWELGGTLNNIGQAGTVWHSRAKIFPSQMHENEKPTGTACWYGRLWAELCC
jgi:hypothetical protein